MQNKLLFGIVLFLCIPCTLAEPSQYEITFFNIAGEPTEGVYTYNYFITYEGTEGTTSIFTIEGQSISVEETQSSSYENLEITVIDSSPNAMITKTSGEQVQGKVAQVTITATNTKERNIVRRGDEFEDIEVRAIGSREDGTKAITFATENRERTIKEGETAFFAQKLITVEDIVTAQGVSSQQDLVAAHLSLDENYNLENFPDMFAYSNKPTYLISGKDAPGYHSIVQTNFVLRLPRVGQTYENYLDNEVPTTEGVNLILIGDACTNTVTAQFTSVDSCKLEPGEAKIELIERGERSILLVTGYGETEMRDLGQRIQNQEQLEGMKQTFTTEVPEITSEEQAPEEQKKETKPVAAPKAFTIEKPKVVELPKQETVTQDEIISIPMTEKKVPWYLRLWFWFLHFLGIDKQ